jgi:hypothetical protein
MHLREIYKIYFLAIAIFALPFISLGVFIIDQFTFQKTQMVFWVLFLIGMLPCGMIGIILSSIGLRKSLKHKSRVNKYPGIIGIAAGIILLCGGIAGLMLIYVVVGS